MPLFFAVVPKGNEELLCNELRTIGVKAPKATTGGVHFEAEWSLAYDVMVYSRLASRLLHPMHRFACSDEAELYRGVKQFPWEEHFDLASSFAIDAVLKRAPVQHTQFVAQRVKDGIVDRFKQRVGERPNVDRVEPDVRFYVVWQRNEVTLGVDLGGISLHQRGYRQQFGEAPLKEHLAAAMLMRAGWPKIAKNQGFLVDPFCGAGTILIEAALMTANVAPGLLNLALGAKAWKKFDHSLWRDSISRARTKADQGLSSEEPRFFGTDLDNRVIKAARHNARKAGVDHLISFQCRSIAQWEPATTAQWKQGLVITNPPYGERLGDLPEAIALYAELGKTLKSCFLGWEAAILAGDKLLGKHLALRAHKVHPFKNGPLDCSLLRIKVSEERFAGAQIAEKAGGKPQAEDPGQIMFANRLRKNLKKYAKWVKKEKISCYRLYDADMPEYNVAVDIYQHCVLVQEYQAPKSIPQAQTEKRLGDVLSVIPKVLDVSSQNLFLKKRQRQKGKAQYQKLDHQDHAFMVSENGLKFEVNLSDYLDTGLFLDHRLVRQKIEALAKNKRFLNLFAYTGTATVYAARGGARESVTVDLSAKYLAWAERNLQRNGFLSDRHTFVPADCLYWLENARTKYDLVFLDPPTFSNSKRMEGTLDIQRDHLELITKVANILTPKGQLVFSNNARKFKLDYEGIKAAGLKVDDWTKATMPPDFEKNPHIHQCWLIERI